MASFIGTFTNKVDKKGRISVPARFRATLAAQSAAAGQPDTDGSKSVVVSPNAGLGAIDACDYRRIEETIARLDERDGLSAEDQQAVELVLSRSEVLPFDGEGRIILPASLLELAGIDGRAMFVGIGRTFQIWSPDRRDAWQAQAGKVGAGRVGLKDLWSLGSRSVS